MAAVMQECMSDRVEATTRAVKVEALNSCSAYKIKDRFVVLNAVDPLWVGVTELENEVRKPEVPEAFRDDLLDVFFLKNSVPVV